MTSERRTVPRPTLPRRVLGSTAAKPVVFALALAPLLDLVWRALVVDLGANPEQTLVRATGLWTLRLLLLTLAVTPLRQISGWVELARLRRMLGLFAFAYGVVHLNLVLWLVEDFDASTLLQDVGRHPFMLAGMAALLGMLPLAATSTHAAVRRLGGARWQALHRLVYAVAVLGCFHFWWGKLAKDDLARPQAYALVLAALLGWRVWRVWRALARRRAAALSTPAAARRP